MNIPEKTAEQMAIAVLKGDMAAACALADHLQESYGNEPREIQPVRRITVPAERVRVVVFLRAEDVDSVTFNRAETEEAIHNWLYHGQTLVLVGVERIEIYELPETRNVVQTVPSPPHITLTTSIGTPTLIKSDNYDGER